MYKRMMMAYKNNDNNDEDKGKETVPLVCRTSVGEVMVNKYVSKMDGMMDWRLC